MLSFETRTEAVARTAAATLTDYDYEGRKKTMRGRKILLSVMDDLLADLEDVDKTRDMR